MALLTIRRVETEYAPTSGGNTVLAQLSDYERVIGCSVYVKVAGNGSGSVSLGTTGDTNGYMTTGNVGAGSTGRKTSSTGTLLAGNGHFPAAATNVVGAYTVGTNTTDPIMDVVLLIVREAAWDGIQVHD